MFLEITLKENYSMYLENYSMYLELLTIMYQLTILTYCHKDNFMEIIGPNNGKNDEVLTNLVTSVLFIKIIFKMKLFFKSTILWHE